MAQFWKDGIQQVNFKRTSRGCGSSTPTTWCDCNSASSTNVRRSLNDVTPSLAQRVWCSLYCLGGFASSTGMFMLGTNSWRACSTRFLSVSDGGRNPGAVHGSMLVLLAWKSVNCSRDQNGAVFLSTCAPVLKTVAHGWVTTIALLCCGLQGCNDSRKAGLP